MVKRRSLLAICFSLALILILVTVALAVFFAPLPQTGVRSADEVLDSIVGQKIQVAGFICQFQNIQDDMASVLNLTLSLADFRDYQGYLQAKEAGALDTQWCTVRPIDVKFDGTTRGPGYGVQVLELGQNVSIKATVVEAQVGPYSEVTGISLGASARDAVYIGSSAGSFGLMGAPVAQKIFYFHMPSAWVSYLSFGVALIASILYLRKRDQKFDHWAHSSVEIGILFATIAILTGPVWAKQEWGVYWRWDDTKLVTTFILWLVYIGYLSLRAAISDPSTKARIVAVYGILGFITVPMSFLSARIAPLLSSSHPEVIASSSGSLSAEAGMTVGIAVAAFTFVFITMLIKRVEIAESEEEIEELKRKIGGEDDV